MHVGLRLLDLGDPSSFSDTLIEETRSVPSMLTARDEEARLEKLSILCSLDFAVTLPIHPVHPQQELHPVRSQTPGSVGWRRAELGRYDIPD